MTGPLFLSRALCAYLDGLVRRRELEGVNGSGQPSVRCPGCGAEGWPDVFSVPVNAPWSGFMFVIPEGQEHGDYYCCRCWRVALMRAEWPPPAVRLEGVGTEVADGQGEQGTDG